MLPRMATFTQLTDKEIDRLLFLLRGSAERSRRDAELGAVSVKDIHLRTAARYEELIRRFEAAMHRPPTRYE